MGLQPPVCSQWGRWAGRGDAGGRRPARKLLQSSEEERGPQRRGGGDAPGSCGGELPGRPDRRPGATRASDAEDKATFVEMGTSGADKLGAGGTTLETRPVGGCISSSGPGKISEWGTHVQCQPHGVEPRGRGAYVAHRGERAGTRIQTDPGRGRTKAEQPAAREDGVSGGRPGAPQRA